ncbi:hypothetical protein Cylst_4069 [Cylindrospermum stagnale PCC 7417]|uniref:Uncharacterized protein n=1 Tax=Cylindrospermum stagnale PCC 7417 TaxID=56107 RepID=K9X283_9NOST|nr:hypothetical protein Cylst_4069 [Cylindrospermum stagnale PCC 7417]
MSKSSKRHLEDLVREIEGAFSTSQYPGDDQLVYDTALPAVMRYSSSN